MSRRPIGNVAMSNAQRCRRYRDKLKALRNATPPADPILDFLVGHPDAVADGIYRGVPQLSRGIVTALRRRLWQAGQCPDWQSPSRANTGARLGWMGSSQSC
jgi:hypothetical protein